MHCKSCDMLVEDGVGEIEGVSEVSSDHKSGRVSVEFDESKTDDASIRKAIEAEGYKVS